MPLHNLVLNFANVDVKSSAVEVVLVNSEIYLAFQDVTALIWAREQFKFSLHLRCLTCEPIKQYILSCWYALFFLYPWICFQIGTILECLKFNHFIVLDLLWPWPLIQKTINTFANSLIILYMSNPFFWYQTWNILNNFEFDPIFGPDLWPKWLQILLKLP